MSSIFDGIGDDGIEQLDENLRKWFKEKWVRFGPDGKIRGACARGSDKEGKPKCLPQSKAHSIGKKGRKYAAAKKRREDPNPERRGPAKNVATKKKTNEGIPFEQCPECRGPIVHESMLNEKQDACYHKVKARYKVWPSAYASGALVQCRKKGAKNWGNKSKANENNVFKGLVDEQQEVSVLYIDGKPSTKYARDHDAKGDLERMKAKFPNKKFELKKEVREGVIVGHDANDPDVAILGGAGTYKLSNVKKKAQMEANELAKDIMAGKFKNSAYNVKQLANTLNTIVAAEEEMEKKYFGEDYTGEFAAEVTPAINPYGGLKDKRVRGAIGEALLGETPTDNPTGASGEGGWRTYKPKSAGTVEEGRFDGPLHGYYIMDPEGEHLQHRESFKTRSEAQKVINKTSNPHRYKVFFISDETGVTDIDEDTAYAGGMGQGGNAGQSYRKFKPKSAGTFKEDTETKWEVAIEYGPTAHHTAKIKVSAPDSETAQAKALAQFNKKFPDRRGMVGDCNKINEDELDEACWKGYHKEGNKKMFGKTYPNCVKNTNEEEQLDEKCWDTHKQVGMKKKGDKMVPNCVPKESAIMKGLTGKRS